MFAGRHFAGAYFSEGDGVVSPVPPRHFGIGGSGIPGSNEWLERMFRLGNRQAAERVDDEDAAAVLRMLGVI